MDEYIVSARKYRPASFDTVVGQRALTTTLKNSITSNKLAHAYLFCGPRGVGKTTCARIFAKAINCLTPGADGEACGECESCKAFNEQRSMNIHELDAASNNSVEDIRELCKQVMIPPQIGRYKVFIIDEVHMLSSAAFNAFLKTLEEPPSYVIFILATTEKHKILPTILSRCQVYDFARMTIQNTVDHLAYVAQKEGYVAEQEALNLIAQKADGGMRDALSIFDQMVSFTGGQLTYEKVCQNLNVLSTDYYFRLVDHFLKNEVQECMLLFNEVLQKGFDGGNFIDGLASHMRDLLVSRDAQTLPLLETSEQMRVRYQEQAQRCTPRFLFQTIKLCNECNQAYRTSRNKRLQVEICLIQAAQLTEEDVPGAGLGPRKILKPLFKQLAGEQRAATAIPASVPQVKASNPTPANAGGPLPTAPSQRSSQTVKKPVLPTLKIGSLGPRIHGTNTSTQTAPLAKPVDVENVSTTVNNQPIEQERLTYHWHEFVNRLPQAEIALQQRMREMQPHVTGANSFAIVVNNQQVANMVTRIQPQLMQHLRTCLSNNALGMQLQVAEATLVQNTFSQPEIYKKMLNEFPLMEQLVKEFQLEFE